jgi:hypothetical protein
MLLGWLAFLGAGLVYFVRRGVRNTGATRRALLGLSTEELQQRIEVIAAKAGGRIGDVTAPASAVTAVTRSAA